jgi:hypothetical protein
LALLSVGLVAALCATAGASWGAGANARLTNDVGGGYVSEYTLATGQPYSDPTIAECANSRGRQNEPFVAVDPRDTDVLLGSSNDYCGVYNSTASDGTPVASGPIWEGYYRSQNSGTSWTSSLVPGYPGDTSPYAALAQIRTASAGDPVIAWDAHGRAFFGAEASGDPSGSLKTFGDEFVARFVNPGGTNGDPSKDGMQFAGSVTVAKGASAPNLKGKFNDKTAIEVDRTGGPCDGYVYYAYSRFTNNTSNIYFVRSTDHGATFSTPTLLTNNVGNVQDPSIAVTGNGHVYVTWDQGTLNQNQQQGVGYAKSTNCGATFGQDLNLLAYQGYENVDTPDAVAPTAPQSRPDDAASGDAPTDSNARDCGSLADHCLSNYAFFRQSTNTEATADQKVAAHEWIYLVYAAINGPVLDTGTSWGNVGIGKAGQTQAYFARFNGATGQVDIGPKLISPQASGDQVFPDVAVDGGALHFMWWDSRNDPAYSPVRPIGNFADGTQSADALDVYGAYSADHGTTIQGESKLSDMSSNPNWEQFDNRSVPFAGDYLTVTAEGSFAYSTWTDWRNTVGGDDQREPASDKTGADVLQCRSPVPVTDKKGNVVGSAWSSDTCPRAGGLDQNIYGTQSP